MKKGKELKKTEATLKDIASSIDHLAITTAKGFQEVHGRIDELDTTLNAHMDGLEQKIGSVHHSVLMLQYDYGKIKTRLENVELKIFGSIQES